MVLSALAGNLPSIQGFAPLPSAVADSFMAMQGGHMAIYFGGYYKFATRLVDSRTNEEFNAMVKNPEMLTLLLKPHYDEITKQFHIHAKETAPAIQQTVIEKAFDLELKKLEFNFKLITQIPKEYFVMLGQALRGDVIDSSDIDVDTDNTPDKFQPPSKKDIPKTYQDYLDQGGKAGALRGDEKIARDKEVSKTLKESSVAPKWAETLYLKLKSAYRQMIQNPSTALYIRSLEQAFAFLKFPTGFNVNSGSARAKLLSEWKKQVSGAIRDLESSYGGLG